MTATGPSTAPSQCEVRELSSTTSPASVGQVVVPEEAEIAAEE